MPGSPERFRPAGLEEHRRAQFMMVARESTPAQRVAWLEEMLLLVGPGLKDQSLRRRAVPRI